MPIKVLFIVNWEYITHKNDYQIRYFSNKFDKVLIFTPDKKRVKEYNLKKKNKMT